MLEYKKDYKAWLYLVIPLLLLSVFTFYPLFKTILISLFSQYDSINNSFGGFFDLQAYIRVLKDPIFLSSIKNTMILVFVSVPISTILALLIAVGLNSIKPLQKVFQTIFFIPYVTNVLAIGMVFGLLFANSSTGLTPNGLINSILGLDTNWIGTSASAKNWMTVVLIYTIWNGLPFKILVFIGGLQNISTQYYDAAKIDSATPRKTLYRITIPLLSPIISYILITSFIGAFKSYESVLSVASGVDGNLDKERWTIVAYVYDKIGNAGLDPADVSYYSKGAAAAVILFIIILIFTAINLQVSKRRVHY